MATGYETDLARWAIEQAALLRHGDLAGIDRYNLADEIEEIARHERRELGRRGALLTAQLLCWKHQPGRRCEAWRKSILARRRAMTELFEDSPSLRGLQDDERWLRLAWLDAVSTVQPVIGQALPERSPWTMREVLDENFWPD